jgi:hypothetical protein
MTRTRRFDPWLLALVLATALVFWWMIRAQ